ncbi:MAG: superoxide dismutase [Candidatus Microgenomates bacterium]|jgi:Fe-Mn family superoxide dismutase
MFTLPDLPYDYKALEPFIDEETMHFHHDRHHATYVKNLNDVLGGHEDLLNLDINDILRDLEKIPEEIRIKVKNNGGGHANHSLFWEVMTPGGGGEPKGKVLGAIENSFGDFPTFQEKFSAAGVSHFGSGWAWLVIKDGKLDILDTPNQDSPVSERKTPILLLDVWEHAYYLKYKNMRADYIKAWWNTVNWEKVEKLFESGVNKS